MRDRISVNGIERPLTAKTVGELLATENVDLGARFLAIAVNGAVVPRAEWDDAPVAAGDDVEIVRPAPGG
jgi:sulfur carrier protein